MQQHCTVCLEEKPVQECHVLLGCSHQFCKSCLNAHVSFRLTNSLNPRIGCPEVDCVEDIHPNDIVHILSEHESLRAKWERMQVHLALINEKRALWCPRETCSYVILCDKFRKHSTLFMCPVSDCNTLICVGCGLLAHPGRRCTASDGNKLSCSSVKRCPSCKVFISKEGGCNFVQCTRCSCEFCWYCGDDVNNGGNNVFTHWSSFCRMRMLRFRNRLRNWAKKTHYKKCLIVFLALLYLFFIAPFLISWTCLLGFPYYFCRDCFFGVPTLTTVHQVVLLIALLTFVLICSPFVIIIWICLYLCSIYDIVIYIFSVFKHQ